MKSHTTAWKTPSQNMLTLADTRSVGVNVVVLLPVSRLMRSSRSAGSLSPGFSTPSASCSRMRSQISSNVRLVWIGLKVGAADAPAARRSEVRSRRFGEAARERCGARGLDLALMR